MPAFKSRPVIIEAERTLQPLIIKSLEGNMQASAGDWIIRGTEGELYPCRDDIFRKKYSPVGKEGVWALLAKGPEEEAIEDDECIILPFPTSEPQT